MKKLLVIFLGAVVVACGGASDTVTNEGSETINSEQNVNENSGNNISPQLETDADSTSRLEVDTISSAVGANKQSQ